MIEKKKIITVLLVFIFGQFPVFSNEEIQFLIKSRQWKKIGRIFAENQPRTESEFFALARYHEESPAGDRDRKFRLLASIAKGQKVDFVSEDTLQSILDKPMPGQTAIIRLTFWKLYKEFNSRKMLSKNNKIIFLEKFAKEEDPVCQEAFEEILKVLYESENYQAVVQKLDSLSTSEKRFLLTHSAKQRYAQSLFRSSSKKRAIETWLTIISDVKCPDYVRDNVYSDFKFHLKGNIYDELDSTGLSFLLDRFSRKESKELYNKGLIRIDQKYDNPVSFKNITRFLLRNNSSRIPGFFRNHLELVSSEPYFVGAVAEELYANKEIEIAEKILSSFIHEPFPLSARRAITRIYFKQHQEKKFFSSLLEYLKENPYDLGFQDKLIDFLTGKNSKGNHYAEKKYWEDAIQSLPNLPVKGRLVYWYFRFLKESNDKKNLFANLENYYELCPGSYYIQTIKDEFKNEIAQMELPSNPTRNKKNLFKFLSLSSKNKEIQALKNKDLSFAFNPMSFELGTRLSSSHDQIHSHRLLNLATEYLRLGEERAGMLLVGKYSDSNNLRDEEKLFLNVGIGDLTNNNYLTIFNTRQLMKKHKIPDDPILLPSSIISRLYPRPHRDIVLKNSENFQVSENIIYAVMRQESFFREAAVSVSNARGLMQVIPSTGKFLARSFGEKDYSLFDPEISVKFGTKFLSDLLKMNGGDLRWATIAYNGGPGNLRKWKRNHYRGDFNHFLEEIPSKESRDYCRIVVSNYYNYKQLKDLFDK